jgi:hypothetical protein
LHAGPLRKASVLVRIDGDGRFSAVDLASVRHARVALPNPVDAAKKHGWKEGLSLRTETITDLSFADGALWVAGLSNEEFAATMWRVKSRDAWSRPRSRTTTVRTASTKPRPPSARL